MTSSKILLVEDDPSVRALLVSYLKQFGQVTDVAEAEAAIRLLEADLPDLLCVDLSLPEASGFAVCRALQQNPAGINTRVMIVTGRASVSDRALARELGADVFIEKPFRKATIKQAARELLSRARVPLAAPAGVSVMLPAVLTEMVTWPAARSNVSDASEGAIRNSGGFAEGSDSNSMGAQQGAKEVARD